jgi:hypothetical protein
MGTETLQTTTWSTLVEDPRWQLVERIVVSAYFAKSDRLCRLLLHICELSLEGRDDEINEVNIGCRLFGRSGYDPSIDGIVRSHASRMRQRLQQYFENEGSQEPIRLLVPKGAYVPVFMPRSLEEPAQEPAPTDTTLPDASAIRRGDLRQSGHARNHSLIWILSVALSLVSIMAMGLAARLHNQAPAPAPTSASSRFWSMLLAQHPTTIVLSDASLAILQDITEHSVDLHEYASSNYVVHITSPGASAAESEMLKDLGTRRFTSFIDAGIVTQFYHLPGINPDWIKIRYARDLRPTDLKDGSVVLLGTRESNPWVEIFETHMNFIFRNKLRQRGFSIINRSPRGDELSQYDFDPSDPSHQVYAVAALRPSLSASGYVLILEGTSAAGTEAAADFMFNDTNLQPFLNKIRNPNGSLPYFEVLLESKSVNGDASQLKIVAYRNSQD